MIKLIGAVFVALIIARCSPGKINYSEEAVVVPEIPHILLGVDDASTPSFNGNNLNWPQQAIKVGTKLIVTDNSNSRILIWNQAPTSSFDPPDVVLGQPNFSSKMANFGGIGKRSLKWPLGVASDGTKLAVTDSGNYRILIWNEIPTSSSSNFKEADVVLGQPDFVSSTANNGGVSGKSFDWPYELESANGNLMLTDSRNGRVLVWNSFPTTDFKSADFAIGKPDLTTNTASTSQTSLRGPNQIWSDGIKLIISDYRAHRMLIWNSLPSNNQPADFVLGQSDFTSAGANTGGVSASVMSWPWGVTSDGDKIVVGDTGNHRLLIWNSWPTSDGQAADVVWGQPDSVSAQANGGGASITGLGLGSPNQVAYIGSQLFVTDSANHRYLVFNGIPTSNSTLPILALGQQDLISGFSTGIPYNNALIEPKGISTDGTNFAVTVASLSRVMIWTKKLVPGTSNPQADIILGQPDFLSIESNNGGTTTAKSLSWPGDVQIHKNKIYVADRSNCRVLVWNSIPTVHHQDADIVIGQSDKTTKSCSTTQDKLYYAQSLHVHDDKLVVLDYGNRVMLWNSLPTVDGVSADIVLGQPGFTTGTANNGGVSATSLNNSWSNAEVWTDGTKLAVSDTINHRILLWNSWPTVNQQAADIVLGQPDFSSSQLNNGGVTASSMNSPTGITFEGGKLYVSDSSNNRILIWNQWPTTNGQASDLIFGQPNSTTVAIPTTDTWSLFSTNNPLSILVFDGWIFRSDYAMDRVVGLPEAEFFLDR